MAASISGESHKSAPATEQNKPEEAVGQVEWIAALAEPYLRGYRVHPSVDEALRGYWFDVPRNAEGEAVKKNDNEHPAPCGFFVGYLQSGKQYEYLNAQVPECLVFAWFAEPRGTDHARLVEAPESLLRKTHTYIGWLTHRPPRFALYTDQFVTLVRHRPMLDWPQEKHEHYSRNFFIETLAWLVRSGVVKKLKSGEGTGLDV